MSVRNPRQKCGGVAERQTADNATMAAMIRSRIFLIASLADSRVDKVVQAAMTMIKAHRARSVVPEAAVDASVRSVQA